MKRLIVISAPSGGGKSVVSRHLQSLFPNLAFSISATTRNRRPKETDGKDYFFINHNDFKQKIENNELVEYEEIFGNYYGTLRSEVDKSLINNAYMLFDIDVKGALSLKNAYPDDTLLIFLAPPNIETLENRLKNRGTETLEQIENRISRAKMEIAMSKDFDYIVVNEYLPKTFSDIENIIKLNTDLFGVGR